MSDPDAAPQQSNNITGIESTPDVCGGAACIQNTRIPVFILEGYRRLGLSDAEILQAYPTIGAGDLKNAWAYVRDHREQIDQEINENEED
jgi:uncharacterized protein (DUF433 family)